MKILSAEILRLRSGTDKVVLLTNTPSPFSGPLKLDFGFQCPRGTAEDYLARHFPEVPITRVFEQQNVGSKFSS